MRPKVSNVAAWDIFRALHSLTDFGMARTRLAIAGIGFVIVIVTATAYSKSAEKGRSERTELPGTSITGRSLKDSASSTAATIRLVCVRTICFSEPQWKTFTTGTEKGERQAIRESITPWQNSPWSRSHKFVPLPWMLLSDKKEARRQRSDACLELPHGPCGGFDMVTVGAAQDRGPRAN